VNFLQALEVVDMTLVTFFISKSRLAIYGRTIGDVTLAEDSLIGLSKVL